METDSTENGTSENDENQNGQNDQAKETTLTTNFLEFGEPKNGEHTIALIKEPSEERSTVGARIYTEFPGDGKPPIYTAKDKEGNVLFPPTPKLWELKKDIKEQARPLLEKSRLAKSVPAIGTPQKKKEEPTVQKEVKAIGSKVLDEGKGFADSAKEILTGAKSEHKTAGNKKQYPHISEKEIKHSVRQAKLEAEAAMKAGKEVRRDEELRNIRHKKVQKSKGLQR